MQKALLLYTYPYFITSYIFLYFAYINIFCSYNFLYFYPLNSIPGLKMVHTSPLQYYRIVYLSIYFTLLESFVLSFVFMLLSSFSTWRIPFSNSCKAGLMVMQSLSFCLSGEAFISPFFKDSFARYSIFGWQLFLSSLWIYHPTVLLSGLL